LGSIPAFFSITLVQGTSGMGYQVEEDWTHKDVFLLSPADKWSGRLNAGEAIEFRVSFSPVSEYDYHSQINFVALQMLFSVTLLGKGNVFFRRFTRCAPSNDLLGAVFRILTSSLPEKIDFGKLYIEEQVQELVVT
jgi:hypothetical protein